jgi:hypothetical protein
MMDLEARYEDRIFDRYEHKFLDCGMVLVVSHLAARGAPIEWLFCDAMEEADRILDHCLRRNRRWWEFQGNLSRDSLPLIGAHVRTEKYEHYRLARPAILELLDEGKLVLVRVDTYYQPNRPNYRTEHRQGHTVALRDYDMQDGSARFLLLDDLDMRALSKVFVDEEVLEQMMDHSEYNELYVLEEGSTGKDAIDADTIRMRYRAVLSRLRPNPRLVEMIMAYTEGNTGTSLDAKQRYQQASDAFKLLSGSRQLYASFRRRLARSGLGGDPAAAEPAVDALLASADAAERLYLAYLKASLTGQASRTLPDECRHWFELEQAAIAAAIADQSMP